MYGGDKGLHDMRNMRLDRKEQIRGAISGIWDKQPMKNTWKMIEYIPK